MSRSLSDHKKTQKYLLTVPNQKHNNLSIDKKIKTTKNDIINTNSPNINSKIHQKAETTAFRSSKNYLHFYGIDFDKFKFLNRIKSKSNRISYFSDKICESVKALNRNLNTEISEAVSSNLININANRSKLITKKLKYIDKLTRKYDDDFYNSFNLDLLKKPDSKNLSAKKPKNKSKKKWKVNKLTKIKECPSKKLKIKKRRKYRNSTKIIENILNDNVMYNEIRKDRKLKDLKDTIKFLYGENEDIRSYQNYNKAKSLAFIRNEPRCYDFSPSCPYEKNKVYFEKKYSLIKDRINLNKRLFTEINEKDNNGLLYTNHYKLKSTENTENIVVNQRNLNNRYSTKNNTEKKNSFKETVNTSNSLTQRNISTATSRNYKQANVFRVMSGNIEESKSVLNTKPNYIKLSKNNKNKNLYNNYLISIFREIIKKGNELHKEINVDKNILDSDINETKGNRHREKTPNIVNIKKIRKDLDLNYNSHVLTEADVIGNCAKRMEKVLRKKDIGIMLEVAKSVLMQDRLVNNQYTYDYILENIRKKIYEKKISLTKKINKNIETVSIPDDTDYFEKTQIKNLLKDDIPDFYDIEYLKHLLCKYNTLRYNFIK